MHKILFLFVIGMFFLPISALADLSSGLEAYYPFNGNANDASGNGNDGTVYNAILTQDMNGNNNSAYYFDGDGDYIDTGVRTPFNLLHNGSSFSVSLWEKHNTNISRSGLMGNVTGGDRPGVLLVVLDYGKTVYLAIGRYTPYPVVVKQWVNVIANPSIWNHLVVTYNQSSNEYNLFVNGNNVNDPASPINPHQDIDAQQNLKIGTQKTSYSYGWATASIDEVRIYNRALPVEEIKQLAAGGTTPQPPPPPTPIPSKVSLMPVFKVLLGGSKFVTRNVVTTMPEEALKKLTLVGYTEPSSFANNPQVDVPKNDIGLVMLVDSESNIAGIGYHDPKSELQISSHTQSRHFLNKAPVLALEPSGDINVSPDSTALGLVQLLDFYFQSSDTKGLESLFYQAPSYQALISAVENVWGTLDLLSYDSIQTNLIAVTEEIKQLKSKITPSGSPSPDMGPSSVINPRFVPYSLWGNHLTGEASSAWPHTLLERSVEWSLDPLGLRYSQNTTAQFEGLENGTVCAIRYNPKNTSYFENRLTLIPAGSIMTAAYSELSGSLDSLSPPDKRYRLAELNGMMAWQATAMLNIVKSMPGSGIVASLSADLVADTRQSDSQVMGLTTVNSIKDLFGVLSSLCEYWYNDRETAKSAIRQLNQVIGKNGANYSQLGVQIKNSGKMFKKLSTLLNLPSYATDALFIWDTLNAPDGQCFTYETRVCSLEFLHLCYTEHECEAVDGYWWSGNTCNSTPPPPPTCDSSHLSLCNTSSACTAAGGYWYNNKCNTTPETVADITGVWAGELLSTTNGCKWNLSVDISSVNNGTLGGQYSANLTSNPNNSNCYTDSGALDGSYDDNTGTISMGLANGYISFSGTVASNSQTMSGNFTSATMSGNWNLVKD